MRQWTFLCRARVCKELVQKYRDDPRHLEMLRWYRWDGRKREWIARTSSPLPHAFTKETVANASRAADER